MKHIKGLVGFGFGFGGKILPTGAEDKAIDKAAIDSHLPAIVRQKEQAFNGSGLKILVADYQLNMILSFHIWVISLKNSKSRSGRLV